MAKWEGVQTNPVQELIDAAGMLYSTLLLRGNIRAQPRQDSSDGTRCYWHSQR